MRGPVNADADPLPRDAEFPKTLIMREIECAANHSAPQSVYGAASVNDAMRPAEVDHLQLR